MAEPILYGNGLIQRFEESLSSAFNRPTQLKRKPEKPIGEFAIYPVDSDTHAHTNEGTERPICEIRDVGKQPTKFYFTFIATFQQRNFTQYALKHSSLQVFHNIGDLIPLFRAEWDQHATADDTSRHAQPHWHFVQRPDRIEEIVRVLISPPSEFGETPAEKCFEGIADCGKFHFAMSPLWEEGNPLGHKQDFDGESFPIWFDNLTKYVADQIAYILMKAPSAPTTDFVPSES